MNHLGVASKVSDDTPWMRLCKWIVKHWHDLISIIICDISRWDFISGWHGSAVQYHLKPNFLKDVEAAPQLQNFCFYGGNTIKVDVWGTLISGNGILLLNSLGREYKAERDVVKWQSARNEWFSLILPVHNFWNEWEWNRTCLRFRWSGFTGFPVLLGRLLLQYIMLKIGWFWWAGAIEKINTYNSIP